MTVLLATKLHQPPLPAKQVQRPHLIQRLNEGFKTGRQVTLISAPAGFGKTICVSAWVNALNYPVSWLSLDAADDDPGRFFSYLVAALQQIDPNVAGEIEGILRAGQLPPAEIISSTLVNDILNMKRNFLLVLDDFQVIQDTFILQVMQTMVANLPSLLHLVLLTREEPSLPLARLRANNQLTEIRAGDLRFTRDDTNRFLNGVMGLSLSSGDVATLEEKTEGWIAGLQLAGLSIRDRENPAKFIATLSGSHRHVLSYLTEEVLNRQPQEIQDFLLQTSILDTLNGNLCNAVTGRSDSHLLLEQLFNANLFLIPLDDEQHWYRYHHLFADMLRDRQTLRQKDETVELHRRASQWYMQTGMVSEAIQHALAGEDYATAVHLIESHAMDMLMQWHLKTVDGWMQAIPPEWLAQSPEANLAFAWMHLMRGDPVQAAPYLQRLEVMFADSQLEPDTPHWAKWLALQSMLLNAQGKAKEAVKLANQALEITSPAEGQVRSITYVGLANAYQQLGDHEQAVEAFQKLIRLGQTMGNSVYELLGISGLALLALQRGQYKFAFEITTQGIEHIERSGTLPPISTAVYGELGVIHYQWHQLEQAHHYFQRAIQVSTLSGYSDAELYYDVILSRLFQIQGDLDGAVREIQKAVDLMQVEAPAAVREEVIAQQVRVYLAQGDPVPAEMLLKDQGFSFHDKFTFPDLESAPTGPTLSRDEVTRLPGILYISALRILLYRAWATHESAHLESGIKLAGRLIDDALQHQYIPFALEALLVRAQLYAAVADDQSGMEDYRHALQLAEPEGIITIFLEEGSPVAEALKRLLAQNQLKDVDSNYVEKILAAYGKDEGGKTRVQHRSLPPSSFHPQLLVEPLSKRELEVLRLIGEGYSNREIAERLVVTLHTVKKHSSNIYDKLGVNSRTQAVARARRLKLL
jgi:LuxR family maltose regulon positive regulatory protein